MTAYTCVLAAVAMLAIAVRFTPTPFQRLAMYPVYAVMPGDLSRPVPDQLVDGPDRPSLA